jgi:vacuolar-type H+-ATPase subunit E/Vma4
MKRPPEIHTESIAFAQPLRDVALARFGNRRVIHEQDLEAAFQRGRIEGERSLSEQLLRQRAAVVDLHNGVLASLRDAVPQVIRDTENVLVEIAFEVARKIAAGAPIDAAQLQASVQEAVAQASDTAELTVQVNPADLALLQALKSPMLNPQDNRNIQLVAANHITRGGCVVQTRFGIIDARRETRAEMLRNSLQLPPESPPTAEVQEPVRASALPAVPSEMSPTPMPAVDARANAGVETMPETAAPPRAAEPQAVEKILQP